MKIGSETHKQLFCRNFIESHRKYEPEKLPWPQLDDESLERLRGIPFWEEALKTEMQAGVMVRAFAATVSDPLLKEAIALQGIEEERHGRLIRFLIQHYGIEISEPSIKEIPNNIEQAFIDFGYGECLDSFLAFGLFKLARLSGYFPEPLFTIFDPVLEEEARHIVFFINWVAYLQVQQGRGAKGFRVATSLWNYGKAVQHLIDIVSGANDSDEGFTATGASTFIDNLTPEMFLSACLDENTRRMSTVDHRLLKPELLPKTAKLARASLKLMPKRKATIEEQISLSRS